MTDVQRNEVLLNLLFQLVLIILAKFAFKVSYDRALAIYMWTVSVVIVTCVYLGAL